MTAKQFLNQMRTLDLQIQSKMDQIGKLEELATKCTSIINGMPHSDGSKASSIGDLAERIVDFRNQIKKDVGRLVTIRERITNVINSISDDTERLLLERRYLCGDSWEQIAIQLGYNRRWVFRIHSKALKVVEDRLKYRFPQYLE